METIITTATVLAMYLNAISSNDAAYLYNADMADGVVNRIEVFHQAEGQQMTQKMEYCYSYDAEGRLEEKQMMRWDSEAQAWTPDSRLVYKYYKNGYNVEVSSWNEARQQYDLPSEVTLFRSLAPNLTSVRTYRMNEQQDNMYLTGSMVVMEPIDSRLLASN